MIDLDQLSRVVLAMACGLSALAAIVMAIVTHPRYTPHMALVAIFSVWFGIGMLDLAFERFDFPFVPDRIIIANLNGAATVTAAGWAIFAFRLAREQRQAVRNEQTIRANTGITES